MTIIKIAADLPNLPSDAPLVLEVVPTSFDDGQASTRPWNGHRVCGVGIGTLDSPQTWYLPLRHQGGGNFPFEAGVAWLKDLAAAQKVFVGLDTKFSWRFLARDGVLCTGDLYDLLVLDRLVDNRKGGQPPEHRHGVAVDSYLRSFQSRDSGRVPVSIMEADSAERVTAIAGRYKTLLASLPEVSARVWDIERRYTKWILRSEIYGVGIDRELLERQRALAGERITALDAEITALAGERIETMSEANLTRVLSGKLGILPNGFTPSGKPQWNRLAFENMEHPIGKLIAERSRLEYSNSISKGWIDRMGDDGRLHADFWQAGTTTGRMSCREPNLLNLSHVACANIVAGPGNCIVYFDYSQVEYRIFAHYTQAPFILDAYKKNPFADFHGMLSEKLGVERTAAKRLNFGMLYGMGKVALIKSLEEFGDAGKIYDDYHRNIPEIRGFQKQVERALSERGWVKNFYGRRYFFADADGGYKAVNHIIQGTAVDYVKERSLALHEAHPDLHMLTTVYDSLVFELPTEQAEEFIRDAMPILEESEFRAPMIVDCEVSARRLWPRVRVERGQAPKFQTKGDCNE